MKKVSKASLALAGVTLGVFAPFANVQGAFAAPADVIVSDPTTVPTPFVVDSAGNIVSTVDDPTVWSITSSYQTSPGIWIAEPVALPIPTSLTKILATENSYASSYAAKNANATDCTDSSFKISYSQKNVVSGYLPNTDIVTLCQVKNGWAFSTDPGTQTAIDPATKSVSYNTDTTTKNAQLNFVNLSVDPNATPTPTATTTPTATNEAPVISKVANQSTPVGANATVKIGVVDKENDVTKVTVTGLPDGLTFNEKDMTISGSPTTPQSSTVLITAVDKAGNTTTSTFDWVVKPAATTPPTVTPTPTSSSTTPTSSGSVTPTPSDSAPVTTPVPTSTSTNGTVTPTNGGGTTTPTGNTTSTAPAGPSTTTTTKSANTLNQISGVVFADNNKNGKFDTGDVYLKDIKVTLQDTAGNVVATATTDASGKYAFVGPQPGAYTVVVDKTGYSAVTKNWTKSGTNLSNSASINFDGTSSFTNVTFGLAPIGDTKVAAPTTTSTSTGKSTVTVVPKTTTSNSTSTSTSTNDAVTPVTTTDTSSNNDSGTTTSYTSSSDNSGDSGSTTSTTTSSSTPSTINSGDVTSEKNPLMMAGGALMSILGFAGLKKTKIKK